MDKWGKLVEQRLQDALAKGEFANLPGKGKPLELDEEPLAEPAQWMARHILRNSGMSLPWVEERQRIEEALALATKRLERVVGVYRRPRWRTAEPRGGITLAGGPDGFSRTDLRAQPTHSHLQPFGPPRALSTLPHRGKARSRPVTAIKFGPVKYSQ